MRTDTRLRITAIAGALAAAAAAGAPAGAAPRIVGPGPCAGADLVPDAGNIGAVRRATLCLVNRERANRGLPRLRANRALATASQRYARQMVAQTFFDHTSPGGTTFIQRIERTSYLSSANGWSLGENLAWGGGSLSTPRAIVRAWMGSAGHRANILQRGFREAGIGVALGTPTGSGSGATYANEFGRRGR